MARKDDVLLAVGSIQADKLMRNIEPTHALLSEIRNKLTFDPLPDTVGIGLLPRAVRPTRCF